MKNNKQKKSFWGGREAPGSAGVPPAASECNEARLLGEGIAFSLVYSHPTHCASLRSRSRRDARAPRRFAVSPKIIFLQPIRSVATWTLSLALLLNTAVPVLPQAAQKPEALAWTREEALAQLELYPQDSYLQYV